jgi:hypothetical protein
MKEETENEKDHLRVGCCFDDCLSGVRSKKDGDYG